VLLSRLDTRILKLTVGGLLLFFSTSMLFGRTPAKSTWGGLFADGTIGFGGGVLGGLAGLSGPLPTMWATIRHHQMLDQPLEPLAVALAIAIMALGSAFQASVGIGLALFVVPLLALVDQSFIPGPMLLAGVILVLITAYRERAAIDVPALRGSLVGLVIGTIAGAVALKFTSGPTLGKTFGVLVLLAVFLSVTGYRFTATRRSLMIAGGAAGIMGAMVGHSWAADFSGFPKCRAKGCSRDVERLLLSCLLGRRRCPSGFRFVRSATDCPSSDPDTRCRCWAHCRPAYRTLH